MTHSEKRLFLIRELLSELPQYKDMDIPSNTEEQKQLLKTLVNIRLPYPISDKFFKIQDDYLKEELKEKGIVDINTLKESPINDKLILWKGDITRLKVDAIVNAANSKMLGCFNPSHHCIDNAIHTASGIELREKCNELMKAQGHDEPTGEAKITPAYNLPSKYIIHTVGPIITKTLTEEKCNQLRECYKSCLKIASDNKLESIAFCCISTGEFHFPNQEAAEIAVATVTKYLKHNKQIKKVIFDVFKQEDYDIYKKILGY